MALVESHRRGVVTAGRVVAVTAGGARLQGGLDAHRPDAVRILAFPHAAEHLSAAAQATSRRGTAVGGAWRAEQARASALQNWHCGPSGAGLSAACACAAAAVCIASSATPAAAVWRRAVLPRTRTCQKEANSSAAWARGRRRGGTHLTTARDVVHLGNRLSRRARCADGPVAQG